ncbi:MAG: hypothetical protein ACE14V_04245 [bacterium]
MSVKEGKKREMVCPHTDCVFYSGEQVLVEGEWVLVSYCSHLNNNLIDKGTNCRLYHLNWQKQLNTNENLAPSNGNNGIETIRRRRIALLKMLRWTVNQLDDEERDIVFAFINELKQLEEEKFKTKKTNEPEPPLKSIPPVMKPPTNGIPDKELYIPSNYEEETPDNGNLDEFAIVEQSISIPPQPESPSVPSVNLVEKKPEYAANSPEAVVQRFIECWNTQDFETEYDLLSTRLQIMPKPEYSLSRQHAFADTMKNQNEGIVPKQKLEEITTAKTEDNFAFVECIKSEPAGRFVKEYQQSYSLVRENGNWKISKIRTALVPRGRKRNLE